MAAENKKYGLFLPKKGVTAVLPKAKNIFGDDSDEEKDGIVVPRKPTVNQKKVKKQTQIAIDKALSEDPSVYEYDSLYDDMQAEKNKKTANPEKKQDKKAKYITGLLKAAEVRKREQERRVERKVQKEREEEGEEFAGKEEFVTSAYKKKMEEIQAEEEKERREAAMEDILDVKKQKDMSGFYRYLYRETTGGTTATDETKVKPDEQDVKPELPAFDKKKYEDLDKDDSEVEVGDSDDSSSDSSSSGKESKVIVEETDDRHKHRSSLNINKNRHRSRSKERSRYRSRSNDKSRKRSRSNERSRKRSVSKERSRHRSRSNDRSRKRSRSNERSRKRSVSKEKSRHRSRSNDRSNKSSRSNDKPKNRSRSNERSRKRSRSKERSRQRSNSRTKDRQKHISKEEPSNKSRKRSRSKESSRNPDESPSVARDNKVKRLEADVNSENVTIDNTDKNKTEQKYNRKTTRDVESEARRRFLERKLAKEQAKLSQ
ncbi:nuclear speckle splicing regulatory protein 1 [Patella vulgata]|uniref:nuclear speckle splicing regulatory protein 1 n=1 Tax=Patella vulgata TaxID=6465 RepID=UPI0021801048|nr:nuclear speckle splicing regulatory protein 1 [Patella vulgata]XP_055957620.1 nuclear speckle splicing regulatory protein 1 [Patella vulgata]